MWVPSHVFRRIWSTETLSTYTKCANIIVPLANHFAHLPRHLLRQTVPVDFCPSDPNVTEKKLRFSRPAISVYTKGGCPKTKPKWSPITSDFPLCTAGLQIAKISITCLNNTALKGESLLGISLQYHAFNKEFAFRVDDAMLVRKRLPWRAESFQDCFRIGHYSSNEERLFYGQLMFETPVRLRTGWLSSRLMPFPKGIFEEIKTHYFYDDSAEDILQIRPIELWQRESFPRRHWVMIVVIQRNLTEIVWYTRFTILSGQCVPPLVSSQVPSNYCRAGKVYSIFTSISASALILLLQDNIGNDISKHWQRISIWKKGDNGGSKV